jgi:hypothetical protein
MSTTQVRSEAGQKAQTCEKAGADLLTTHDESEVAEGITDDEADDAKTGTVAVTPPLVYEAGGEGRAAEEKRAAADEARTGATEEVTTGRLTTSGVDEEPGKLGMTAPMAIALSVSPEGVIERR